MSDKIKTTTDENIANRNNWLKIFVVVIVTTLLAFKLWQADFTKVLSGFDFSDLLALFLAMFSIVLAVAFYFKATDTSNTFYDNTYRFTKDVSEILGRVEAGFGEKLKHLDEGYVGIKEAFDKLPFDKEKAEKDIKEEEEQLDKVLQERDEIIEDLANKAQLEEEEKIHYFRKLNIKDKELEDVKVELNRMRRKIENAKYNMLDRKVEISNVSKNILREVLFKGIDFEKGISLNHLNIRFAKILPLLPSDYAEELEKDFILDEKGDLTEKGYLILKNAIEDKEY